MNQNENTQNQFSNAIKELQIGKLMRKSNITKSCGISAYEVFQFLLLLVFQGRNLFRFLNSKRKEQPVSKNTYYRFLNDTSFNWTKFLLLLAAKVTNTLGWSDDYSFTPIGFNLLSSARKINRYQEISDKIDHRTTEMDTPQGK